MCSKQTTQKLKYSSILDPAFLKYLYEFSFGDSITLHTGVAYYANACIPYVELEREGERGIVPPPSVKKVVKILLILYYKCNKTRKIVPPWLRPNLMFDTYIFEF